MSDAAFDVPSAEQPPPRTVLDARDVSRALTRISHEILERNKGADDLVLLGIRTRGVPLAHRLAARIADVEPLATPLVAGALDITMHRDDLRRHPTRGLEATELPPGGIDDRVVVLVDDVLTSGATIRAAAEPLRSAGAVIRRTILDRDG